MVGEPRPHPATGRFIREEELREPLFTKDHKVRGHVDGRVINAGLAPVDHPADALRVVDEHMAHVEIAMHHHGEIWPRRIVVEPALPPVEALVVHHELASDAVNVVGHLLTGLRRCTDEHPRIHGGGNGDGMQGGERGREALREDLRVLRHDPVGRGRTRLDDHRSRVFEHGIGNELGVGHAPVRHRERQAILEHCQHPRLWFDLRAYLGSARDAQHPPTSIVDGGDHDPIVEPKLIDSQRAMELEPMSGCKCVQLGALLQS
ncbi:putative macrolide phosphotransferase K [Morganella morganii]|nr:putative macrolide phosphotransferase K [Morganella morganii]